MFSYLIRNVTLSFSVISWRNQSEHQCGFEMLVLFSSNLFFSFCFSSWSSLGYLARIELMTRYWNCFGYQLWMLFENMSRECCSYLSNGAFISQAIMFPEHQVYGRSWGIQLSLLWESSFHCGFCQTRLLRDQLNMMHLGDNWTAPFLLFVSFFARKIVHGFWCKNDS